MRLDGIVLDLDDTLYDTTRLLLPWADRRAAAALRGAGLAVTDDEFLRRVTADRLAGVWSFARVVAALGGAPSHAALAEEVWLVYDPPAMRLEPEVARALTELASLAPIALLTSGDPGTQRAKVDRLGIAARFADLAFVPRDAPGGKPAALAAQLARLGWDPRCVIVCGDRPDADIRAANRNGCRGVLVRSAGSEFAAAKPTTSDDVPWRTIERVAELPALLRDA